MKKLIVVSLLVEGLHKWQDCPLPEVYFLVNLHRHVFHIKAKKEVTHNNRDIEIILFKKSITEYLNNKKEGSFIYFGNMSCEMIAQELILQFDLYSCEVLEDGENGAELINI